MESKRTAKAKTPGFSIVHTEGIEESPEKTCSGCGVTYTGDLNNHFGHRTSNKDGLKGRCKVCCGKTQIKYRNEKKKELNKKDIVFEALKAAARELILERL